MQISCIDQRANVNVQTGLRHGEMQRTTRPSRCWQRNSIVTCAACNYFVIIFGPSCVSCTM
jgi:hypothetical protein